MLGGHSADHYRSRVEELAAALQREDTRLEASEMLRGLIDSIVLMPEKGELRIELRGNLAAMLTAAQQTKRSPQTGDLLVPVQLVAGARNRRYIAAVGIGCVRPGCGSDPALRVAAIVVLIKYLQNIGAGRQDGADLDGLLLHDLHEGQIAVRVLTDRTEVYPLGRGDEVIPQWEERRCNQVHRLWRSHSTENALESDEHTHDSWPVLLTIERSDIATPELEAIRPDAVDGELGSTK